MPISCGFSAVLPVLATFRPLFGKNRQNRQNRSGQCRIHAGFRPFCQFWPVLASLGVKTAKTGKSVSDNAGFMRGFSHFGHSGQNDVTTSETGLGVHPRTGKKRAAFGGPGPEVTNSETGLGAIHGLASKGTGGSWPPLKVVGHGPPRGLRDPAASGGRPPGTQPGRVPARPRTVKRD